MGDTLTGIVERVTFENETTGFRVVRLREVSGLRGYTKLTIVGRFSFVGPGTNVRVTGKLETDGKHGERFSVESLLVLTPETEEGILRYLASGAVRGVGPKTAEKIVQYFGKETLRVLDGAPHRLLEVPGLGKKKVDEIRESYFEQKAQLNLQLLLSSLGEGAYLAERLIREFGSRAQEKLEHEPYLLAEVVRGIGFLTADRLALAQGLSRTHPDRLRAGLLHSLYQLSEEGHSAEEKAPLVARTAELLKVEPALLSVELDALWASEKVYREGEWVQSRALYLAEQTIAVELARLRRAPSVHFKNSEELLAAHEAKLKFSFTPEQRSIIVEATKHSVVVITGGPGVGKTTIVSALVSLMKASGRGVALAAPTGRAAKRLTEATGTVATTLHRLLEVDPLTGKFKRNSENKLDASFVLVDEVSMMDVFLMASLCAALPDAARLVLVGDKDQLPSVGAGAVLRDILASGIAAAYELKTVHRQSAQSGIIVGAREVLLGRVPEGAKSGEELREFYVVACSERAKMQEMVLALALERIPKRFGLTTKRDVQILTPMHRSEVGTEALNRALSERLTGSHEKEPFLPGDRVIQLKNNYELDIYNGDMGEVVTVGENGVLVEFEGTIEPRRVLLEGKSLKDLALSYAISIHKSQGSEFPAVIIPLSMSHYLMLHRKLLYTAITRAKRLCVLVVEPKALSLAVSEFRKDERKTRLLARLAEVVPKT